LGYHTEEKEELVRKAYQVFGTLGRAADTQAIKMKVDKEDFDVVNIWKIVEKPKGTKALLPHVAALG
jgi:hypothetical protein